VGLLRLEKLYINQELTKQIISGSTKISIDFLTPLGLWDYKTPMKSKTYKANYF